MSSGAKRGRVIARTAGGGGGGRKTGMYRKNGQKKGQAGYGSDSGSDSDEDLRSGSSGDESQTGQSQAGSSRKHNYFDDFTLLRGNTRDIRTKMIGFIKNAQTQLPQREFLPKEPRGSNQAARCHITAFGRSYEIEVTDGCEGHPELDATTISTPPVPEHTLKPVPAEFYQRLRKAEERLSNLEETSPEVLDWLFRAPTTEEQPTDPEQTESLVNEWVR